MIVTVLFLTVSLVHLIICSVDPEEFPGVKNRGYYVDCRYLGPVKETPLIRPKSCIRRPSGSKPTPIQIQIYLLKKTYATVEGWSCDSSKVTKSVYGTPSGCYATSYSREVEPMTADECRALALGSNMKEYTDYTDNIRTKGREPCAVDYDCCYTWRTDTRTDIISSAVRSEYVINSIGNVEVPGALSNEECKPSSGECKTERGYVIWRKPKPGAECKIEESDIYTGTMLYNDRGLYEITIPDNNLLMFISEQRLYDTNNCAFNHVYITDEGFLVQILNGSSYTSLDMVKAGKGKDLLATTKTAPRVNAMFEHLRNETEWSIYELHHDICENRNRIWTMAFLLEDLEPIKMIRMMMDRDDVTGVVKGGTIKYQECLNLKDWRFLPNGRCGYKYKIVKLDGSIGCVDPGDIYVYDCESPCPPSEGDLNFMYNETHLMKISHSDITLTPYNDPRTLPEPKFSKQSVGNLEIYGAHNFLFPKSAEQRFKINEERLMRVYEYTRDGRSGNSDSRESKWSLGRVSGLGVPWGWISSWGYLIYFLLFLISLSAFMFFLIRHMKKRGTIGNKIWNKIRGRDETQHIHQRNILTAVDINGATRPYTGESKRLNDYI